MVSIKVFTQYSPKPIHNSLALNLLVFVNFVLLLLAVVIIGLACNIYYFIYITYILPKLQEEDEVYLNYREQNKIFSMIEITNIKDKMRWVED